MELAILFPSLKSSQSTFDKKEDRAPSEHREARPLPDLEGRSTLTTRALRSHQLWLTLAYFGLLSLMARGFV